MRWENLFDDLEGQLEQELGSEEVDLRAEEERLRLGRLSLRDRLVSLHRARGREPVRFSLVDGRAIAVSPLTLGKDWLSGDLVGEGSGRDQCILPLAAIASVLFDRDQIEASLGGGDRDDQQLGARLGLSFVLRDLCRRRRAVRLELAVGATHGTIDRVGRDHLDLAVHEAGIARRETAVSQYRSIPFSQLRLVLL